MFFSLNNSQTFNLAISTFKSSWCEYSYSFKTIFHIVFQVKMLDLVVKVLIMSKSQVQPYIVQACRPVLLLASHADFNETLMPSLQKAMLRNPELALHIIGKILGNLSLDLSQYAFNVGKMIAGK